MIWMAAAALVLTGCGSGDDGDASDKQTPTPSAATSSEAPTTRTLTETCPLLEQAAPSGQRVSYDTLTQFTVDLATYSREGDAETQLAIDPVREAAGTLADAALMGASQAKGWAEFDGAMERLATRCQAAGSSAFQG